MDVKLSICVTSGGTIKTDTVACLIDAFSYLPYEKYLYCTSGGYKQLSLTMSVQQAIERHCTHIMFIDNDMIFPPDGIKRLIEWDKPIIGANYNEKKLPLVSTVKVSEGSELVGKTINEDQDPFKAYAVGLGFMLVKMYIFKTLTKPWFNSPVDADNNFMTDDVYFCKKAGEHGIEVWCDPRIKVLHEGGYLY